MFKLIKKLVKRFFKGEEISVQQQPEESERYTDTLRRFSLASAMHRLDSESNKVTTKKESSEKESEPLMKWTWFIWKEENARQVELFLTK
ncbi:hypothetical protein PSYJYH_000070 [Bacillus phage PSYJ-YH]|nr:hypothetical protein PSYJYH_000070 [Bacillus phage PSYJ-YH]